MNQYERILGKTESASPEGQGKESAQFLSVIRDMDAFWDQLEKEAKARFLQKLYAMQEKVHREEERILLEYEDAMIKVGKSREKGYTKGGIVAGERMIRERFQGEMERIKAQMRKELLG